MSPSTLDSRLAPAKAPKKPGSARIETVRQSVLPRRQCEAPETSVVPTSDMCTAAEAAAGITPVVINSVDVVTPYAMPRQPSTSCAKRPTRETKTRVRMGPCPYSCNPSDSL